MKFYNYINEKYSIFFLLFLLISWLLYPIMLSILFPKIKYTLIFLFILLLYVSIPFYKYNKIDNLTVIDKMAFIVLLIYILDGLVSSIVNMHSLQMIMQYIFYLSKYMIFFFFLLYLKEDIIWKSYKLYANISFLITILAIIVALGDYYHLFSYSDYLTNLTNYNFKVYYGSYYHYSDVNFFGNLIYRLQGLSEEAGTFALSLMPAFLWFLLIEKNIYKIVIILIGMIWSFSIPVFGLFFIFVFILKKANVNNAKTYILYVSIIVFLLIFFRTQLRVDSIFTLSSSNPYLAHADFAENRVVSFNVRIDDFLHYIDFFSTSNMLTKIIGLGAGASIDGSYNHSDSIGYLVKFVDYGFIGGLAHLIIGLYLFYVSIVIVVNIDQYKQKNLLILISLSTITSLSIAWLRQPYDISYWQMWIYATLFYYRLVFSVKSSIKTLE